MRKSEKRHWSLGRSVLEMVSGVAAVALSVAIYATPAFAIEGASSLNPVGSGARAAGMGGAFIATADDATAASWNPAGLVHLEKPEFSLVYGYFNRDQSFSSGVHPEVSGNDQSMNADGINYASVAVPFTLFGKNVVTSLNYQRLIDMNKSYGIPTYNFDPTTQMNNFKYSQNGYLSTISPAFAIQVMPELYVGVALNIWNDFLGASSWESTQEGDIPLAGGLFRNKYKYTFSGLNATVGALVNLDKLSIGAVVKSPFNATIHQKDIGGGGMPDKKETWKMPMSVGLGLAYRFSDKFSSSIDAYWTQWSASVWKDFIGAEWNPIAGDLTANVGKPDDTTSVRLGAEYLFINDKSVIPVRAGLFYDPQPGFKKVDDYYGFSLGSGYTYQKYSFDIAYQLRKGNNISAPEIVADGTVTSTTMQHTVLTSFIYRF